MSTALLPREFADLEPFAATWCLPNEGARYATRLASTIGEMQDFYDAMAPRAEAAISYCDTFAFDDLPAEARNLLHLLYALITVSFAVECWGQPQVPDTGAAYLDLVVEPGP